MTENIAMILKDIENGKYEDVAECVTALSEIREMLDEINRNLKTGFNHLNRTVKEQHCFDIDAIVRESKAVSGSCFDIDEVC